jgi:hypothetical protein
MLTSKDILDRIRHQRTGIVVRLYVSDVIPTVRVDHATGAFLPAMARERVHVGNRYMRAA